MNRIHGCRAVYAHNKRTHQHQHTQHSQQYGVCLRLNTLHKLRAGAYVWHFSEQVYAIPATSLVRYDKYSNTEPGISTDEQRNDMRLKSDGISLLFLFLIAFGNLLKYPDFAAHAV